MKTNLRHQTTNSKNHDLIIQTSSTTITPQPTQPVLYSQPHHHHHLTSVSSTYTNPRSRRRILIFSFFLMSLIFWITIFSNQIHSKTTFIKDLHHIVWNSNSFKSDHQNSSIINHQSDLKDDEIKSKKVSTPILDHHLIWSQNIKLDDHMTGSVLKPPHSLFETDDLMINLPMQDRIRPKLSPHEPLTPLPIFEPNQETVYEDVRPNSSHLPLEDLKSSTHRFLSYLPHSGFHNQRIELQNGLRLARLLNRTLIVPELRLGRALAWESSTQLIKTYQRQSKAFHLDCVGQLKNRFTSTSEECQDYSQWTSVQANYLLKIDDIAKLHPLIHQPDLREAWLWDTLQLSDGDWYQVEDQTRYSYQLFESSAMKRSLNEKYEYRLNLEDLKAYHHIKLLSFGSLFGSDRLMTETVESKVWKNKVMESQLPNLSILQSISDSIAESMGGRGTYIGLHLRVGDLYFRRQAPESMPKVFKKLCSEVFHLNQTTIEDLIQRHERILIEKNHQKHQLRSFLSSTQDFESTPAGVHSEIGLTDDQDWNSYEEIDEEFLEDDHQFKIHLKVPNSLSLKPSDVVQDSNLDFGRRSQSSLMNSLKCRGSLYTDPDLKALNSPIYLATDISKPIHHLHLSIFFNSFPCVFVLKDFMDSKSFIDQFKVLENLRSSTDGLKLHHFLHPLLEAIISAKGSVILGTPGSTFSDYAISILHAKYLEELHHSS